MSNAKRPPMAKVNGRFTISYEKSLAQLDFSRLTAAHEAQLVITKHFPDCEFGISAIGNDAALTVNFQSATHDGPGAVRKLHHFLLGLHEGWMLLSKAPAPQPEDYFTVTHFQNNGKTRELHRLYPVQGRTPAAVAGLCCCIDESVEAWGKEIDCVEVFASADDWAHKKKPLYTYTPIGKIDI